MASPEKLNFADLLAPISNEFPAGSDIRQDSSPSSNYQKAKSARSAARAAERSYIHDGESTEADEQWRKIISLAPEILINQSKDLEVASWLTEALVRRYGFQGLRDGVRLIHELIKDFWEHLHPLPDDDGITTRAAPLSGLNGEGTEGVLLPPIRRIPITEGDSPGPFSLWQYQQALEAQRIADENTRERKIEKLGFSIVDIENAINESSTEFINNQVGDIEETVSLYKKISQLLDELCGIDNAPPTRNIINLLEECRGAIYHIGKNKICLPSENSSTNKNEELIQEYIATDVTETISAEAITSRESAFQQISRIAEFFRRTEPHSPVSYALEKAVTWGKMPLDALILELIPDSSSREHYSKLTGVKNHD